jgi:hypothetical protein
MTQWRLTLRKKSLLLIQTVPLVADRPISGRITGDVDSVRRSQPRKPKHPQGWRLNPLTPLPLTMPPWLM